LAGLLTFFLLEIGVRIFIPQPASWLPIFQQDPRHPFFSLIANAHCALDTGETRWEVWTDDDGHRHNPQRVQAGKPKALWVGDSFSFGHGVDYDQTWIGLLESRDKSPFHHVNAGVPTYGPVQYQAVLEDLLQQPGEVGLVCVTTFLGNDFHDTIWSKDVPVKNGTIDDDGGLHSWVKKNVQSYRLITRILHKYSAQNGQAVQHIIDLSVPENWAAPHLQDAVGRFRDSFSAIASACASRGIPLVVIVIPTPAMIDATRALGVEETTEVSDERGTHYRALSILNELGLRVIDATPALAQHESTTTYFKFDGHLTPLGHAILRDLLLRETQFF
jgi:hypothetical protein